MLFLLKNEEISVADGALFSVIAMLIVFAVLAILVICIAILSKIKFKKEDKNQPQAPIFTEAPKKISAEDIKDDDMMVAALVATADYVEETKKTDARVVSIKQIG